MKREHWFFIKDIGESIRLIADFIGTMSFEEFLDDDKTKSAVAFCTARAFVCIIKER